MRTPARLATVLLFALTATPTVAGQSPAPKAAFVQALGQFGVEIEGAYGDEGDRLPERLADIERGLDRWDDALRASEAAIGAELAGADPASAARLHVSRAALYLERGRFPDALETLGEARELAPDRVDVQTLLGLVYSQLANRPAAATDAFRRAAALAATDPVPAYTLARHLERVGDVDAAAAARKRFLAIWEARATGAEGRTGAPAPFIRLGLIQEATDVDPFFPPALYAEGFALLRQGAYEPALAAFREAVAGDPLRAWPDAGAEAMARATAAFRSGSLEAAVNHLQTAIRQAPAAAEPRRVLGLVRLAALQYEEAIDALEVAVRLDPADERARLSLAFALTETTQYARAEQALRDAVAALPGSGRARYSLASLYERQGRPLDAVPEFEAAVAFNPLSGLNTLYRTIGRIRFELRDVEGTIEAYERRIDVHPNDADAHHLLARAYAEQGRYPDALAEFAITLVMNPDHHEAWAGLGDAYLATGQFAKAEPAVRRALAGNPALQAARYTLATALMRLGRSDEGRRELQVYQRLQAEETAVRAREYELSGLRREASVSVANHDYEQAVALLRKALLLDPTSATSHMSLGLALLGAGQYGEAIERLQTAASLNAPVEVHQHLADAYEALGQDDASQRERTIYERMRREATGTPR